MTEDILLYGLHIRSALPLPGRPAEGGGGVPDLEIVVGATATERELRVSPGGEVLAHHELSPTEWSTFARLEDGTFRLRFSGICDFVVDPGLRRAEVHACKSPRSGLVPVFAAGALPSFVLIMKSHPVLHASAVDVGGEVVAFIGRSGMGKSTMATLCCATGAALVSDDVLRLAPSAAGQGPRCYLGPGEVRLRGDASLLTSRFPSMPATHRTGDGRSAVHAGLSPSELLPLGAVIIPLPDRAADRVTVRQLDPARSCLALLAFPRFIGWRDPASQAEQFRLMADVASLVPIYEAHVPWGPPFDLDVARNILAATSTVATLATTSTKAD